MTPAILFLTIFSAVTCAGMLLIVFIWGLVAYSRHEKIGTAGSKESRSAALAILAPLIVAGLVTMAVLDKVPAWLDAILI